MSSSAKRRREAAEKKAKRQARGETPVLEIKWEPGQLFYSGPIINTWVCIADAQRIALERDGLPIPEPVKARFLIDTGADRTLVRHDIAEAAGLKLIDENKPIQGVGVDSSGRVYMGSIRFVLQSKRVDGMKHNIEIATEIMSAELPSNKLDGLIGRDVLQHVEMSYSGPTGRFQMKFKP